MQKLSLDGPSKTRKGREPAETSSFWNLPFFPHPPRTLPLLPPLEVVRCRQKEGGLGLLQPQAPQAGLLLEMVPSLRAGERGRAGFRWDLKNRAVSCKEVQRSVEDEGAAQDG